MEPNMHRRAHAPTSRYPWPDPSCIMPPKEFYCVLPAADPFRFMQHLRACARELRICGAEPLDVRVRNVTDEVAVLAAIRDFKDAVYP